MGIPSATVLPFSNSGHRSRIGSIPFKSEWSSAKPAIRLAPAAARDIFTDSPRPGPVIVDFADARKSGRAKRIRQQSSNNSQAGITLVDLAALVYVVMAAAFYPALAWFLVPS